MREEMRGGKPVASAAMTMAARALEVAAYLKQHGGSVTKRETALKKVKVPGLVAEESAGDSSL
jgi:hypothetical protein